MERLIRALISSTAGVTGVVGAVREELDGQETQRVKYARIRFRTSACPDVTFESEMAIGGRGWTIGDAVQVRYRLDHPETAEVDSVAALWGASLLFALLGVAFLGMGMSIWLGFIPIS
jgi:hypothetical protein